MEVQKTGVKNSSNSVEKKKKLSREVTVKTGLKQEDNKEGVIVEALLDSRVTGLVMSLEFVRKDQLSI